MSRSKWRADVVGLWVLPGLAVGAALYLATVSLAIALSGRQATCQVVRTEYLPRVVRVECSYQVRGATYLAKDAFSAEARPGPELAVWYSSWLPSVAAMDLDRLYWRAKGAVGCAVFFVAVALIVQRTRRRYLGEGGEPASTT